MALPARCGKAARGVPLTRKLLRALLLGLFAFAIFGPIANLVLWAFAERWFWPNALPSQYGFAFWQRVFSPRGGAWTSMGLSVGIALLTVVISLALAVPAGYALARRSVPLRAVLMLLFLLPQALVAAELASGPTTPGAPAAVTGTGGTAGARRDRRAPCGRPRRRA